MTQIKFFMQALRPLKMPGGGDFPDPEGGHAVRYWLSGQVEFSSASDPTTEGAYLEIKHSDISRTALPLQAHVCRL